MLPKELRENRRFVTSERTTGNDRTMGTTREELRLGWPHRVRSVDRDTRRPSKAIENLISDGGKLFLGGRDGAPARFRGPRSELSRLGTRSTLGVFASFPLGPNYARGAWLTEYTPLQENAPRLCDHVSVNLRQLSPPGARGNSERHIPFVLCRQLEVSSRLAICLTFLNDR